MPPSPSVSKTPAILYCTEQYRCSALPTDSSSRAPAAIPIHGGRGLGEWRSREQSLSSCQRKQTSNTNAAAQSTNNIDEFHHEKPAGLVEPGRLGIEARVRCKRQCRTVLQLGKARETRVESRESRVESRESPASSGLIVGAPAHTSSPNPRPSLTGLEQKISSNSNKSRTKPGKRHQPPKKSTVPPSPLHDHETLERNRAPNNDPGSSQPQTARTKRTCATGDCSPSDAKTRETLACVAVPSLASADKQTI